MKKLMIIVPNLQGGGQERIAALTSKILEDEFNIFFIVFNDKDSKYNVSSKSKYINLNIPETNNILKRIINVLKRAREVKKIRDAEKIDYCFSFGRTANIVNCLSKKSGKTIVSVRNTSIRETEKKNLINDIVYTKSDAVICISEGLKEKILRLYSEIKDRIFVLYNPCDISRIENVRKSINKSQKQEHVIYSCGRLESMKCYKNLFNAIRMVREEIEDVQLKVLGEGSQRKELEEYITQQKMSHYIILQGFVDEPYKHIGTGDVFAFSSSREGFANVLVEAMASGVPVISTDCDYGPHEILSGEYSQSIKDGYMIANYGVLSSPFTENSDNQKEKERSFADGIIELLNNQGLREQMVVKGIQRAKDFSMESYRTKLLAIISRLNEEA